MTTGTILDEIIEWKRVEVAQNRSVKPLDVVQSEAEAAPAPRDLTAALRAPGVSLIAEIKRASPSRGLLRPNLDPAALAHKYAANGAAAISVLTDARYFQGDLEDLGAVRHAVDLPVLRKDFILNRYQVFEARAAGADALLLIVATLTDVELSSLYRLARELGMAALVEVHSETEVARALALQARIIGINNRDLRTFQVSLETTARLRPLVPTEIALVAESGIHTPDDVARLAALDVDAMLVGESLVRAQDVGAKVRELVGNERTAR
jgi:indole-3-glycerol phosphate synthase